MKFYGKTVIVKDGNVEKALRKFKKKVQDSGLLQELRDRETYEKRWRKQLASQQLPKKLY
jgi:ribosomal protein S21